MVYRFIDCQCFAGGFTLGAVQAGFELVAKREKEGGFGAPAVESNRHILGNNWQLEACSPSHWTPIEAEAVFANPPCSGWSVRSVHVPPKGIDRKTHAVSEWTNSFRGENATINQCMWDVIEYSAKCPGVQTVVFESVQQAGRAGLPLMRKLRNQLEQLTGNLWDLHHVFHNNLSCGGNSDRPRYFFVASRIPFGTLKTYPLTKIPRADEVLNTSVPGIDGNETPKTAEARRTASLLATGVEWNARETVSQAAGRFVEAHGIEALKQLDAWNTSRLQYFASRGFRPDQYQPRRWAADAPCPVITGKIQESVHPTAPRVLTLREGARVLGYPEEWKLSSYKTDSWLGKGIPVGSGNWIAKCVKLALDGKIDHLERGTMTGDREWVHDNTRSWKPDNKK